MEATDRLGYIHFKIFTDLIRKIKLLELSSLNSMTLPMFMPDILVSIRDISKILINEYKISPN